MKKTLLIILLKGKLKPILCFGSEREMRDIGKDAASVGQAVFYLRVEGPKTNMQAIEVAWETENEVLPKAGIGESRGGLQTMLKDLIRLVATHPEAFAELVEKK